MDDLTKPGRIILGISIIAFGLLPFVFGNSLEGLMPFPASVPGRIYVIYFDACIFVVTGFCIAAGIKTRLAAMVAGLLFFLLFLGLDLPKLIANLRDGGVWTGAFELIALCGAAFIAGASAGGSPRTNGERTIGGHQTSGPGDWMSTVFASGRYLVAVSFVVFGIQHFMYANYVATIIPSWIPFRLFLTYLVGAAFFAFALSIVLHILGRLSSLLMASMFFLWLLILHGPLVINNLHMETQWTSFFVAMGMGGTFLLLADRFSKRL